MKEVAIWLVNKQPSLSRATWRQYRSALICFFEESVENASFETDRKDATALLLSIDCSKCQLHGVNTSSKKQKKISEAEQEKLVTYFVDTPAIRHSLTTLAWLLSGIYTGLRPSEWRFAQLTTNSAGANELQVRNAKNTNGRSHGPTRTLCLNNMTEAELTIIRLHLANVASALDAEINALATNAGFENLYHHCRDRLYIANRTLWPQRTKFISLYSARHQFSADAKKTGLSKTAIAAIMGHASQETAGTHYGRRVSGRGGGLRVSANQADIARVQQLNAHRSETERGDNRPHM